MSASVTPFRLPETPLASRLAARRRLRAAMREAAPCMLADAFNRMAAMPEARGVDVDQAMRVLALALRRELARVV